MTTPNDYYALAHSDEGVGSGFQHKTVPHLHLALDRQRVGHPGA